MTTIHLRQEQKPLEHRSFSPSVIQALVEAGYTVAVEHGTKDPSRKRIFEDAEYEAAGATLVEEGSWVHAAPGTLILGLKELNPTEDFALWNDHIAYMHCFKGQEGWQRVLSRFLTGGTVLYDLEYLVDEEGRRCSAFSYMAGLTGAALSVKTWAWELAHPGEPLPAISTFTEGRGYYLNEEELINQIKADLESGKKLNGGRGPRAIVLGALGVCGRGACDMFHKLGLPAEDLTRWDLNETKDRPGPYEEISHQHDIFLNAIYLSKPIPPFVTKELLAKPGRQLKVIVDASCDITNPNNPIPIYNASTTFNNPTLFVEFGPVQPDSAENTHHPVSVVSIDHLPSMLPREASEAFSAEMRPWLLQLRDRERAYVWVNARKIFEEKLAEVADEVGVDVCSPKYSISCHRRRSSEIRRQHYE